MKVKLKKLKISSINKTSHFIKILFKQIPCFNSLKKTLNSQMAIPLCISCQILVFKILVKKKKFKSIKIYSKKLKTFLMMISKKIPFQCQVLKNLQKSKNQSIKLKNKLISSKLQM